MALVMMLVPRLENVSGSGVERDTVVMLVGFVMPPE